MWTWVSAGRWSCPSGGSVTLAGLGILVDHEQPDAVGNVRRAGIEAAHREVVEAGVNENHPVHLVEEAPPGTGLEGRAHVTGELRAVDDDGVVAPPERTRTFQ